MGKIVWAFGLLATSAAAFTFPAGAEHVTHDADYIVVGGGPAGLVLAERLSRDGQNSVILLEAGPASFNVTLLNSKFFLLLLYQ
jgi:NADPH-dependent 2,4-dienoyl-CoA reductase/sulfur reductase-like enzyme